jgi:hypothetical protein
MNRSARAILFTLLLLAVLTPAMAETSFQAITLQFGEVWTGNAYRQPYVDVTGSEGTPIDFVVGGGARFTLIESFLFESGALTMDPRLVLGVRRYLLFQNGRAVPADSITALGEDEDGLQGFGSARVLSATIGVPFALEIGAGDRIAVSLGFSPTLLLRFRAGDLEVLNERSDLNGMYRFFYEKARWLRPEVHLAGRFDLSEYFAFALRATWSFSIVDIFDTTLPAWDQMQAAGILELCLTPPLSGLFRGLREEESVESPAADQAPAEAE